MKYKIEELKDITDSREIMKSRPSGFSRYTTYIIIAFLCAIFIWSVFANKQVTVKASGVVRPGDPIYKISSGTMGNITHLNIAEGRKVKKGDTLVIVNGLEYKVQKDVLEKNLQNKNKELEANKKLKSSILDGVNYLNENDEVEKDYYKKYTLFLDTLKSGNSQTILLENQKDNIRTQISDLRLLLKCYEEERNNISKDNYLYYQYRDYELTLISYRDAITNANNKIKELEVSKNDNNKLLIQTQIDELQKSIEITNKEIEKYKNNQKMNILNAIAQNENKLKDANSMVNNGDYKGQHIAQIDANINALQNGISDIKINLEIVNTKLDATSIKAQYDGVINLLSPVEVGSFIQNGTEIASIISEDNKNYKVEIYIDNQNFGEIKEGDDVTLEFGALPQREYGIVKSKLTNISVDSKVEQKEGKSYYKATCELPVTYLINKNGEKIDIKNGMIIQVRVINREISYLRWYLEKINLID